MNTHAIRGYYFITDAALSRRGNAADVQQAVVADVRVVQYRSKGTDTRRLVTEAAGLRAVAAGILFLVNDRIDVALAVGADGVHLGQEDMPYEEARRILGPHRIIGLTVHTVAEAVAAARAGADYLGVSPIFATTTKEDAGAPAGLETLRAVRQATDLPLVAIGGITRDNAPAVIAAGADSVCAISAVVTAEDARREMERFQKLFQY